MRRLVIVLLLTATAFAASSGLQSRLERMAVQHQGKVALYAKNLKTGDTVAIDADRPVKTASVIKLPVMIEAFYQVKAGKHRLDEKITLTKENQVLGSGVLPFLDPGLQLTLKDAITLMMIVSDNTGTNLVIDAVGIPAVNERIKAMGLKNTWLYKKVYLPPTGEAPPDQKQFGLGKTTAREMAEIMASVQRCDLGDRKLCDLMIGIMRNQQYRNMIPHYIETVDTSEIPSAICDKVGALDAVRNDVALVQSKSGPLVISIFTYDNKDQTWIAENQAEQLIAKMAKLIVDTWSPEGLQVVMAEKPRD
ncbi:MAG: serine hydrolase [Terriglobales bacterium]